ncbi:MAG: hypothetical protein K0R26_1932 [Bacteroidota bacterium]|jgi:hypothetical protein|nr:hypothetical protein [Bacteroidota bacterium]
MVNQTDQETRPPGHRSNSIKAALHILEHSNADPIEKIKAALIGLYPEDIEAAQKALLQTLNTLNQKT